jgi:hypothetical protein
MPCRQVSTYNGTTGSGQSGGGGYTTEADCLQACKEGACCEGTTCTVKPQCQCQGTGQTFKGVGTTCTPNPCLCPCCMGAPPDEILFSYSALGVTKVTQSGYGGIQYGCFSGSRVVTLSRSVNRSQYAYISDGCVAWGYSDASLDVALTIATGMPSPPLYISDPSVCSVHLTLTFLGVPYTYFGPNTTETLSQLLTVSGYAIGTSPQAVGQIGAPFPAFSASNAGPSPCFKGTTGRLVSYACSSQFPGYSIGDVGSWLIQDSA